MRRQIVTHLLQESETLTGGNDLNSFDTGDWNGFVWA